MTKIEKAIQTLQPACDAINKFREENMLHASSALNDPSSLFITKYGKIVVNEQTLQSNAGAIKE